MMSQMDPREFDRVRAIVIAAQNILEAAEHDRVEAKQLLANLQALDEKVERSLGQIPRTIGGSLSKLANATAELAAARLSEKFVDANKAARDATLLFEAASRKLTRKYWTVLTVSQTVFALVLTSAAFFFIPSKEEIASRKYELNELQRSIQVLKQGKR